MWSKIFNVKLWLWLFSVGFLSIAVFSVGIFYIVVPKLPAIDSLSNVQFQVPLRIYSRDAKLIAEYGEKKRTPLSIDDTPKSLVHAVMSAEDEHFYTHPGVDYRGLIRAVVHLVKTGRKGQGGSTITMQVARNFFLSRKKTYLRKLNEILLSFKIEQYLSKNQILELYINKIYLGNRSYGFGAAAKVYYGKPIDELVPAQIAMLAGLPKAPSRYNPVVNRKRAIQRRNYVLGRMYKLGYLDKEAHKNALDFIDDSRLHGLQEEVSAPYVAEMVRAEMVKRYKSAAYNSGFRVYTSVDSRLQLAANNALRKALLDYTERHGYRGPIAHVDIDDESIEEDWAGVLAEYTVFNGLWPAMVLEVGEKDTIVYQPSYGRLILSWDNISWAKPWRGDGTYPRVVPKTAAEILKRGDIIRITRRQGVKWRLSQMPNVEGALVSLSPEDGSILALVGGFNFTKSKFNRVIQAERQPGSNLKPFIYSAGLENGFTAATLINDAPVVFEDAGLESTWRPENYSGKVFGPTRLRVALMKSRNLVSIRLLRAVGISTAIRYLTQFGFNPKKLPRDLSLALGSAAITPMQLVTGYAVFANGGYKVEPYFIDRIETDEGEILFEADPTVVCRDCEPVESATNSSDVGQGPDNLMQVNRASDNPGRVDNGRSNDIDSIDEAYEGDDADGEVVKQKRIAKQVVTPQNVYIMSTIMRDVIQFGTGKRAKKLGRSDIHGKTGTTNEQKDAWFSGFTPDVVATAWVGFDTPKTLGSREFGSTAALPMWMEYMKVALDGLPQRRLERPPGLVNVRINATTGLLDRNGQFEIFRVGHVPQSASDAPAGSQGDGGRVQQGVIVESGDDAEDQLF
ncbi:MAG: penicillin-binding protein 1A [Thiohalomonadales bacterium]